MGRTGRTQAETRMGIGFECPTHIKNRKKQGRTECGKWTVHAMCRLLKKKNTALFLYKVEHKLVLAPKLEKCGKILI